MDTDFWYLFSVPALSTLAVLILLQAVLGFDNLLYISIESKRAPEEKQAFVRRTGILMAIGLRIVLLFVIMSAIDSLKKPLFTLDLRSPFAASADDGPSDGAEATEASAAGEGNTEDAKSADSNEAADGTATSDAPAGDGAAGDEATANGAEPEKLGPTGGEKSEWKVGYQERGDYWLYGDFTFHSLITLFGGVFILYTAVKEVLHLLAVEHIEGKGDAKPKSAGAVIFMIVLMNLIFSLDSILSAMALTKNFWVMAVAIVVSGLLMLYLADTVSEFLKKNRMYEVLGLFILFIVGVMLIGEGGHLAHLQLFTYHVEPMAKSTFYFSIGVLVVIDIVQSKYRKKLLAQREHELQA
ncbi:MAG: hypothetical protein AAF790_09465 [Planctomycetota bacterium]